MTHPTPDPLDDLVAEVCAALPYGGDYTHSREELMAPIIRAALLADRARQAERVAALEAALKDIKEIAAPTDMRDGTAAHQSKAMIYLLAIAALADRPTP